MRTIPIQRAASVSSSDEEAHEGGEDAGSAGVHTGESKRGNCSKCKVAFTLTKRATSCKMCAVKFCKSCAPPKANYEQLGFAKPCRLCPPCLVQRMSDPPPAAPPAPAVKPARTRAGTFFKTKDANAPLALEKQAHEDHCHACNGNFTRKEPPTCLCAKCLVGIQRCDTYTHIY